METKKQIRKRILEKRDALSEAQRKKENDLIYDLVMGSSAYKQADGLLVFASFGSEADTFRIAGEALCEGKILYYPLVTGDEMEFYRVDEISALKPGFRGILEPEASDETKYIPRSDQNILMLMPGVVFDRKGGRIGYGGGFYDKYLEKLLNNPKLHVTTIAIAFSCQILDEGHIPQEEHDISPDYVISSEEILCFQQK